ncbi:MAG: SMC-Scp complex subunit ScpB [Oscillospiraceae bacterium]|jgi:segregation and condensation protein B|nr:SMC-Scp complex subunit ScpB [Oscillospiraceae bacterium]
MEINNACGAIEAVLFASGDPVETAKIAQAVELEEALVYKLLQTMKDRYEQESSGLLLVELEDSFQLCTKPEYASVVKQTMELRRNTPLSNAAMEVLAIIAYNQPVTRAFVEQVRGVDSSQTVLNLVEKGLVEEAGRLDIPGRPISYRTTQGFLRNFGMKSLEELPPLPDEDGQLLLDEAVRETSPPGEEQL